MAIVTWMIYRRFWKPLIRASPDPIQRINFKLVFCVFTSDRCTVWTSPTTESTVQCRQYTVGMERTRQDGSTSSSRHEYTSHQRVHQRGDSAINLQFRSRASRCVIPFTSQAIFSTSHAIYRNYSAGSASGIHIFRAQYGTNVQDIREIDIASRIAVL